MNFTFWQVMSCDTYGTIDVESFVDITKAREKYEETIDHFRSGGWDENGRGVSLLETSIKDGVITENVLISQECIEPWDDEDNEDDDEDDIYEDESDED